MSETWTFPEPEPSKEWDEARRLINETTQKWMRDRVESFERYCVTRIVQIVREEIAKGEPAPPVAPWRFLSDSEKALLDELANCPHDHTNAVVWLGDALTGRPAPPVAERGDDETFDKVVWGFLRPDDEVQRMLADLRERCAKACDALAVEFYNGDEAGGARCCADAIRALPLTPDAPSKP